MKNYIFFRKEENWPSDPEFIGRRWNVSAFLCKSCLIRVIYSLLYCYLPGLEELTSVQSVRILGGVQTHQPSTAPCTAEVRQWLNTRVVTARIKGVLTTLQRDRVESKQEILTPSQSLKITEEKQLTK